MRLRASEFGLQARASWFETDTAQPIAQVDFEADPKPAPDELASAIAKRHTNRRMYHGPDLTEGEKTQLGASLAPGEGVRLIWLQGPSRRRALNLIWRAESERFLRERLHEELFSSIRFDLSWHETADRALPPAALEVEAPMRPLFKALRHWSLMRPLTWIGAHRLLGLRAGWLPCWQAPTLGLLATPLPAEQGAIAVGAAFERLWLRANILNLALQPMAASVVLPLQVSSDRGASHKLRCALSAGWQAITPAHTPMMVFRMGRAAKPAITSRRLPLGAYVT
jgi:hypothetical protein